MSDNLQKRNEPSIEDITPGKVAQPLEGEFDGIPEDIKEEIREENSYYSDQKYRLEKAKADRAEEYVKILEQDRGERSKYANKLFTLICVWLVVITVLIIGSGYKNDMDTTVRNREGKVVRRIVTSPQFELSDTVLLALIGGTTASVLGLFVIVANYLFNTLKPPED